MKTAQLNAIAAHGLNLLCIFPEATERDPVKLCKKLRRLEREGGRLALALCNDARFCAEPEDVIDGLFADVLARVNALLGNESGTVPIFVNRDPRGYALKIDSEWCDAHSCHVYAKDWGGYGILAPEIGG